MKFEILINGKRATESEEQAVVKAINKHSTEANAGVSESRDQPTPPVSSVGEEFPKEQARVRELLTVYKQIPTGGFGAMMIEAALKRADEAAVSGDVVAILRSYEELKGCQ